MGWNEETTEFHDVYIKEGWIYIGNYDVSENSSMSSVGSLNKDFLLDMPDSYEISSKVVFLDSDSETPYCGAKLYGASTRYNFYIDKTGLIDVYLYDQNRDSSSFVMQRESEFELNDTITWKIVVDGYDYQFFLDDFEIGKSTFAFGSLQDIRIFTSNQTRIAVDYLRIKASGE